MYMMNFFLLAVVIFVYASTLSETRQARFGYNRNDYKSGPSVWQSLDFNFHCNGNRQSPINIQTQNVLGGQPYSIQYNFIDALQRGDFFNNGHTAEFEDKGHGYTLEGVPFHPEDKYEFEQLHFHIGRDDSEGSEHTVNGKQYPGEIHFVNFNKKYGSMQEAVKHSDGLAVLAVFIQVPDMKENTIDAETGEPYYYPTAEDFILRKYLPAIKEKGLEVADVFMKPVFLLPTRNDFYYYKGSLTTPPCSEVVTWVIYRDPIVLSRKTLELLRSLKTGHGNDFGKYGNYRPTQPLNSRTVYANFAIQNKNK